MTRLAPAPVTRVLVTGATGNVGREVVRALLARGIEVRGGVRAGGSAALPAEADAVPLDFEDPATFAPATAGADGIFLLRPPALARVGPTLNELAAVARAQGVRHAVLLSVIGADRNPLVPHHRVERHLARHGPPATMLRAGFFAQNLGDAYRRDIAEDDRLYVPARDGRVSWVDVRDVAEVAARAFLAPHEHAGTGYALTGGEARGFADAAALLTAALGRPIRYEPAGVRGYVSHLRRRGMPLAQVAVLSSLHLNLRSGRAARIDPTLGRLLGRAPLTLADYVRDHPGLWARPLTR